MKIPANNVPLQAIPVRVFGAPMPPAEGVFKILLVKLDHIGDFITAIDAFGIVRRSFPKAQITLICLPSVAALAVSTGLFDLVKGMPALPDSHQLGKVPKMYEEDQIASFTDLLDGPYFLAADFKHDIFDKPMLDHVEAACRAGFARATAKGLDIIVPTMEWEVPVQKINQKNMPPHAGSRLALLAHAIADALVEAPRDGGLFQSPPEVTENPLYRALAGMGRMKIGISIGAGSELRKWPVAYWVELTQRLHQKHNAHFVFFGSAGDAVDTDVVTSRLPPDSFTVLCGAVPLEHIPAYMKLLKSYIGCDTGLTHMAARLNVPTVNIFAGISNASVWRARGPRVKTVYAEVVCAPCHLRFKSECPNGNVCMSAIVPGMMQAILDQLFA